MSSSYSSRWLPVSHQLKIDLTAKIKNGELQTGDKILSEPALSRKYKISRWSVRKCLKELEDRGFLYRIGGKGTFVSANKILKVIKSPSLQNGQINKNSGGM